MSTIPVGAPTTGESGSTMKLPSAEDTKAWQTALATAAQGKGPLTPAVFENNGYKSPTGYQVIEYGHDDSAGYKYSAATALAVFGNRAGPEGTLFLDRANNTATLTSVDPLNGRPDSAPETVRDVGGHLVVPAGLQGQEIPDYGPANSVTFGVGADVVTIANNVGVNGPTGIGASIDTPAASYGYYPDTSYINDGGVINPNTDPNPTDTSRMLSSYVSWDLPIPNGSGSAVNQFPALADAASPALPEKPSAPSSRPGGALTRYE
jgi:hypothetical protein